MNITIDGYWFERFASKQQVGDVCFMLTPPGWAVFVHEENEIRYFLGCMLGEANKGMSSEAIKAAVTKHKRWIRKQYGTMGLPKV